MPFVRIDTLQGRYTTEQRAAIGTVIYEAVRGLGAPEQDRFQVFAEKAPGEIVYGETYLGLRRSDGFVAIQVTLNVGRDIEQKRKFYKAVADGLAEKADVRCEDVFINLIEVPQENWSFGNGEAQYA